MGDGEAPAGPLTDGGPGWAREAQGVDTCAASVYIAAAYGPNPEAPYLAPERLQEARMTQDTFDHARPAGGSRKYTTRLHFGNAAVNTSIF